MTPSLSPNSATLVGTDAKSQDGDQEVKLTEAGGDEKVADEKGYASESSIDLDAPAQQAALPAQQAQYHYHELERVRPVTTTL